MLSIPATPPTSVAMTTRPVTINLIDGREIMLPRLCPLDYLAVLEKMVAVRKAALRVNLDEAGIAGLDRVKILNEYDSRHVRLGEFGEWATTIEGAIHVIEASIARIVDPSARPRIEDLNLSFADCVRVVNDICNFEQAGKPRPTGGTGTPASPVPTATSDATPPSSGDSASTTTP
jgi:hypothetical protein